MKAPVNSSQTRHFRDSAVPEMALEREGIFDRAAITLRDKAVHAYLKEVMMARRNIDMDEALRVILSSDGDNPFRDMLELIVQNALEVEISAHLGAERSERKGDRTGE